VTFGAALERWNVQKNAPTKGTITKKLEAGVPALGHLKMKPTPKGRVTSKTTG